MARVLVCVRMCSCVCLCVLAVHACRCELLLALDGSQEARHMQVAEEMEALFETKVARLTDQMKHAQASLDESRALADAREAELLSVLESTKRKIVDHCKDILVKSKSREDDLQVCVCNSVCVCIVYCVVFVIVVCLYLRLHGFHSRLA